MVLCGQPGSEGPLAQSRGSGAHTASPGSTAARGLQPPRPCCHSWGWAGKQLCVPRARHVLSWLTAGPAGAQRGSRHVLLSPTRQGHVPTALLCSLNCTKSKPCLFCSPVPHWPPQGQPLVHCEEHESLPVCPQELDIRRGES